MHLFGFSEFFRPALEDPVDSRLFVIVLPVIVEELRHYSLVSLCISATLRFFTYTSCTQCRSDTNDTWASRCQ